MRARSKAHQAICMNNLRQIGIAMSTYSDEFDSFVMPGKFGNTASDNDYNHWINYMYAELLPDQAVFRCPALTSQDNFDPNGANSLVDIRKASYIRNTISPSSHSWNGARISSDPERSMGWGTTANINPITIHSRDVIDPWDKINVTDVAAGGIAGTHRGITQFQETDHGVINRVPLSGYRRVGYHHGGGFNALMGDGHVEFLLHSRPDQWVVVIR